MSGSRIGQSGAVVANRNASLREFIASGGDLDSIPNLRAIASAVVYTYAVTKDGDLAEVASGYEEEAEILDTGDAYQERVWN